jgi:hypothetical protein
VYDSELLDVVVFLLSTRRFADKEDKRSDASKL